MSRISVTTRVFIQNIFSRQHGLIKDHMLINFKEISSQHEYVRNQSISSVISKGTILLFIIFCSNLSCKTKFTVSLLMLHYGSYLDLKIWPHAYSRPHVYWFWKNCPPTMLIQDHTVVQATRVGVYIRWYPTNIIDTYTSKTKSGSSKRNLISC